MTIYLPLQRFFAEFSGNYIASHKEWDSSKGKEGGGRAQAGTVGWLSWAGPLLPVLCCEQSACRHNLREGSFDCYGKGDTRRQFGSQGQGLVAEAVLITGSRN